MGKHSLKTSQVLTEFRIGKNKADIIILNGTSTVYEIKSEYDSFLRLNRQISSYSKAFEFVNIVTSPSQTEKALNQLPENIGILSFTKRNTISTVRKPKSNIENIDLSILFESLRKEEYLQIIKTYYGNIPKVPNTKIFNECKMLYCDIPIEKAIKLTFEVLKKRNYSDFLIQQLESRFDNIIFRLGLAGSRAQARQKVSHGHFLINGRPVNIPSYRLKKGDKITINAVSQKNKAFSALLPLLKKYQPPSWLKLDIEKRQAEVIGLPTLEESAPPAEISTIFEYYSR